MCSSRSGLVGQDINTALMFYAVADCAMLSALLLGLALQLVTKVTPLSV